MLLVGSRGPLIITLIPLCLFFYGWVMTYSNFNPEWGTKFKTKSIILINILGGGPGGLLAAFQLLIKDHILIKKFSVWVSIVIGTLLGSVLVYYIIVFEIWALS